MAELRPRTQEPSRLLVLSVLLAGQLSARRIHLVSAGPPQAPRESQEVVRLERNWISRFVWRRLGCDLHAKADWRN